MKIVTLAKKVRALGGDITADGIRKAETRDAENPGNLAEIAQALGLSERWLRTEKGPKYREGPSKPIVRAPKDQQPPEAISEIDVRAGAGGGGIALEQYDSPDSSGDRWPSDAVKGEWGIPANYLRNELRARPADVKIVEVLGDSMEPTLSPGDRLLVDSNHKMPSPPGVFAVWDGFGVVVKRVELIPKTNPPMVRLISDNSRHGTQELSLEDARIIGRIIARVSAM